MNKRRKISQRASSKLDLMIFILDSSIKDSFIKQSETLLPWDLVAASVLTRRTVWNGSHSNGTAMNCKTATTVLW